MICGKCGSGVVAEEKFKRIKGDGSLRRYVYYHCNKYRDYDCNEGYIREEVLVNELVKIVDQINFNENITLEKIKKEIDRYQKFNALLTGSKGSNNSKIPQLDIKAYAKYLLLEGTREEKREIISCLKTQIYLKSQKIYIN